LWLALAYVVLLLLAWRFQERIAFPAPRGPLPDGERITITLRDGTTLAGIFLPPAGSGRGPGLLWFYGNSETIGAIWPIIREFRPPDAALLIVDYPGYGASGGRPTEAGLYEAAESAYATLTSRPEVDPTRIFVYGRSLGTAVACWIAARRPVAGLVLESPFTNARDMSRQSYGLFPRFVLRLKLDNLEQVRRVRAPVLIFHGTADRLVPLAMGRRVAAAAQPPAELVELAGATHNTTYEMGGTAYRDRLWAFLRSR
jgi:fermentation-respiration switch protein FrsA (DUF1100 family)